MKIYEHYHFDYILIYVQWIILDIENATMLSFTATNMKDIDIYKIYIIDFETYHVACSQCQISPFIWSISFN